MTTYNWQTLGFPAPVDASRRLSDNTTIHQSVFTGAVQKINRTSYWSMTATWRLTGDERADVLSFLLNCQRADDTIIMPYWGHTQRGAFGGSPLVNGAGQTGSTVNIDGASNNITGWVKAGDWLRFSTSSNHGHMVTADANSDGSGLVSVNIIPPLVSSPTDGEIVYTTTTPAVACHITPFLCMSVQEWSDRAIGQDVLYTPITAEFVEDMLIN